MWKILGKILKFLRSIFVRTGKAVSIEVDAESVTIVVERQDEGDDENDSQPNSILESSGD